MNKLSISWFAIVLIVIILAACNPAPTPVVEGSYPAPETIGQPGAEYPAPEGYAQSPAYPLPESPSRPTMKKPNFPIVPIKFDKPIMEGVTAITGTGPAQIPILIVDITLNGIVLGQASIEKNGAFQVIIEPPLEKGHRIGVTIDNLAGTKWEDTDFSDPGFFGDEHMLVPMMNFFYDTAMTGSK